MIVRQPPTLSFETVPLLRLDDPHDIRRANANKLSAVFWKSGQTKVEGFVIDIVSGDIQLGWSHLSDSAVSLFREEYRLPLVPPELAAPMAAFAEHFFPLLILLDLATRLSAFALPGMPFLPSIARSVPSGP